MGYSTEAREIMAQIENSIRTVFDVREEGILTVRFFSMSREITKSASFSKPEGKDDASIVCDKIPFDLIMSLRKEMYDDKKGTWLTATARLDCLTEEFAFIFNYDVRPNIFNDDFIYTENDDIISPDREEILSDFKKFSRSEEFIPEWVNELLLEQQIIDETIKNTDPYDLFSEAIETEAILDGDFALVYGVPAWEKLWKELSNSYIDHLVNDDTLISVFVEPAKAYQQSAVIFDGLEIDVSSSFIDKIVGEMTVLDRASIVNSWRKINSRDEIFDIDGDDEIDTDTLDDEFGLLIGELVMEQTKQRFPDLDSSNY